MLNLDDLTTTSSNSLNTGDGDNEDILNMFSNREDSVLGNRSNSSNSTILSSVRSTASSSMLLFADIDLNNIDNGNGDNNKEETSLFDSFTIDKIINNKTNESDEQSLNQSKVSKPSKPEKTISQLKLENARNPYKSNENDNKTINDIARIKDPFAKVNDPFANIDKEIEEEQNEKEKKLNDVFSQFIDFNKNNNKKNKNDKNNSVSKNVGQTVGNDGNNNNNNKSKKTLSKMANLSNDKTEGYKGDNDNNNNSNYNINVFGEIKDPFSSKSLGVIDTIFTQNSMNPNDTKHEDVFAGLDVFKL